MSLLNELLIFIFPCAFPPLCFVIFFRPGRDRQRSSVLVDDIKQEAEGAGELICIARDLILRIKRRWTALIPFRKCPAGWSQGRRLGGTTGTIVPGPGALGGPWGRETVFQKI